MSVAPPIYELFAQYGCDAADEALGEALPRMVEPYVSYAARTLLRRRTPRGLVLLIAHFHLLRDEIRDEIIRAAACMVSALHAALHERAAETRVNALAIAEASGDPRLAELAAVGLHDNSPRVRLAAAVSMRVLTERFLAREADTRTVLMDAATGDAAATRAGGEAIALLAVERRSVLRAAEAAVEAFTEHHRSEALEAAMFFALDLNGSIFESSVQRRGVVAQAMMDAFEESDDRRLATFGYLALRHPETRSAAARRIEVRSDGAFFREMLSASYLLRDSSIRGPMEIVRRLAWLAGGSDALQELPSDLRSRFPAWLLATGLPIETKIDLLTEMALGEDRSAARAAVFELARLTAQAAVRALEAIARQGEEAIQQIAIRALQQRSRMVARSRRRARADLSGAGGRGFFDSVWETFDRIDASVARSLGRRVQADAKRFFDATRARLADPSVETRGRAIRMVLALGLARAFVNDLAGLAGDDDAHIRATALSALASAGGPTARRVLERALLDADPSVIAGAVDGLDRLGLTTRIEVLAPLMLHDDPGVRAGAIRALLHRRVTDAARALLKMMSDSRRNHRIAALTMVERMRLTSMRSRVAEMASSDADPAVRRAAEQVADRLARPAAVCVAASAVVPEASL